MTNGTDILSTLATQFLPQMTPVERRAAIESLQSIIDAERFKLTARQLSNTMYMTSWRKCKNTPYLFMEYWEGKVA